MQANNGNAERRQTKVQLGTRAKHSIQKTQAGFYNGGNFAAFLPRTEMVIGTEASHFALEAIFAQFQDKRLHPVAFHSRRLNSAERHYDIHDKELLPILEAFMELKHHLYGADKLITVYTHNQNLQHFLTTKKWNQ